jgi:hypothetical protein
LAPRTVDGEHLTDVSTGMMVWFMSLTRAMDRFIGCGVGDSDGIDGRILRMIERLVSVSPLTGLRQQVNPISRNSLRKLSFSQLNFWTKLVGMNEIFLKLNEIYP